MPTFIEIDELEINSRKYENIKIAIEPSAQATRFTGAFAGLCAGIVGGEWLFNGALGETAVCALTAAWIGGAAANLFEKRRRAKESSEA